VADADARSRISSRHERRLRRRTASPRVGSARGPGYGAVRRRAHRALDRRGRACSRGAQAQHSEPVAGCERPRILGDARGDLLETHLGTVSLEEAVGREEGGGTFEREAGSSLDALTGSRTVRAATTTNK